MLRFDELELDPDAHAARIGERQIELTRTEYQLLELLMLNPRRVLTSELIYDRVWGYDFGPLGQRAARVHRVSAPQARGRRRAAADPDRPRRGVRAAGAVAVSLRRRIAAAAALAVAVAAIAVGRDRLRDDALASDRRAAGGAARAGRAGARAAPRRGPARRRPGGGQGAPDEGTGFQAPAAPPLGGAPGYFQVVRAGRHGRPTAAQLPVTPQVLSIARSGAGSFFTDAQVQRHPRRDLQGVGPRRPPRRAGRAAADRASTPS